MARYTIFKTKADINGNTYYLIIDFVGRRFSVNPHSINPKADAIITRRTRKEYIEDLRNDGFTECNTL